MTNGNSGGERIQLSEWEHANLYLPPVTTVTFYPGAAPVPPRCRPGRVPRRACREHSWAESLAGRPPREEERARGCPAQNLCVHSLDPDWVSAEKASAREEGQVPFISTNDALTSWFFREMKCDVNLMVANLRGREPSILGLGDAHARNYEANVPYFPGDVEAASMIRQSIRAPDGGFRARRAGSPETPIPSFRTLLKNRAAIVTNWAGFLPGRAPRGR